MTEKTYFLCEKTHFLYSTTCEPNDKPLLYNRLCTGNLENNCETNDSNNTFLLSFYKKIMKTFN